MEYFTYVLLIILIEVLVVLCLRVLALVAIGQILLSVKELLLDRQPRSIESGFEKLWQTAYISASFFGMAVLFVLFDLELIVLLPTILIKLNVLEIRLLLIMGFVTGTLFLE